MEVFNVITNVNELIKIANDIHKFAGAKYSITDAREAMFALEWYQEVDQMIDRSMDQGYTISRFYNWTYEVTREGNDLIKHDSVEQAASYLINWDNYAIHKVDVRKANMQLFIVYMDDGLMMKFWAEDYKHAIEQANDGYGAKALNAVVA
jgi:hypothetical protein